MKKKIWAIAKRALHTLAQTAIATIGTTTLLEQVNWKIVLSASLLAALLSVLKSIAIGVPEIQEEEKTENDVS